MDPARGVSPEYVIHFRWMRSRNSRNSRNPISSALRSSLLYSRLCAKRDIRISPQCNDLFTRRSHHIQCPLHIPNGEMRGIVHIQTPLSTEDGQPSAGLTIVCDLFGRCKVCRWDWGILIEQFGFHRPYYISVPACSKGEEIVLLSLSS